MIITETIEQDLSLTRTLLLCEKTREILLIHHLFLSGSKRERNQAELTKSRKARPLMCTRAKFSFIFVPLARPDT